MSSPVIASFTTQAASKMLIAAFFGMDMTRFSTGWAGCAGCSDDRCPEALAVASVALGQRSSCPLLGEINA
jgi:hypothetical protein